MRSRRRHCCTCHTPLQWRRRSLLSSSYVYSAVFIFLRLLCDLLLIKYICTYIFVHWHSGTGLLLTRIDLLLLNEISFYETDNRSEKNVHNRGSYCTTRDVLQCWDLTDTYYTYCTILYIVIVQYNTIPVPIFFCGLGYGN